MTTAYYLWEHLPAAAAGDAGPAAADDLGQLLDLLQADLSTSISRQPRGLTARKPRQLAAREMRGLTLRRWARRIAFVHGD